MKIYFIRHGQSDFNAGNTTIFNSELTPKGIEQAYRVALGLDINENYKAYTSPYTRCLQTAMSIQNRFGITFTADLRLGESPEKLHYSTCYVYKANFVYPTIDWSNYPDVHYYKETQEEYKARLKSFIVELRDDCVLVSHMRPIVDMIEMFTGQVIDPLLIKNGSISLLENGQIKYLGLE